MNENLSCGILTSTPRVFRRQVLLQKFYSDPRASMNKIEEEQDKPEYKNDKTGLDL